MPFRARPGHLTSAPTSALVLMALGATLFSCMNLFARLAATSASWMSVAAVRAGVGALVAYGFARARGRSVVGHDQRAMFLRSLFGTVSMLLSFRALTSRSVSLGDTVTLLNLSPVFLALLAPIFLKERTSGRVAIAIALALSGVVLVTRPAALFGGGSAASSSHPSEALTVVFAVSAALASSAAMMLLRRVGQTETPEAIAFHFSVVASVTLTVLSLFDLHLPTGRDACFMLAAGLSGGLAQLAMTRAYALEQAARVSSLSYLSVVVSAALGSIFLGEQPGPTALAGTALVVAGGLVVSFTRRTATTYPDTPPTGSSGP